MANLVVQYDSLTYALKPSMRWSGPNADFVQRLQWESKQFWEDEQSPGLGPPMTSLSQWLRERIPRLTITTVEEDIVSGEVRF